jgi:hypothetical protein
MGLISASEIRGQGLVAGGIIAERRSADGRAGPVGHWLLRRKWRDLESQKMAELSNEPQHMAYGIWDVGWRKK